MNNKSPDQFLKEIERASKGRLKIYIGAAPGVGKTYQMLRDAHEMKENGIDIVIGLIETYGRKGTIDQIGDLEVVPLKQVVYKNVTLKEMDLESILKRKPQIVIVDELAHTNVPYSKNEKRYEDVLEIIDNGISVMTAVNIQHFESLNDYVNRMTGVKVRETIPDTIMDYADEVEVIDISIDALRDRLRQGKIYSSDKVETALNNFFRVGNLNALRELTLREVANEVDEHLMEYKNEKSVDGLIGAQEKILVCVNLNFNAEYLIRRGYRLSKMLKAPLFILNIKSEKYTTDRETLKKLDDLSALCMKLGAEFKVAAARDPAEAIIEFAKENAITQVIIGQSARTRTHEILKGSIVRKIMRGTKYVDVMVVADPRT
ncbi:KdpD-like non-kinase potassium sensor [Clostridium sp. JN-9]|uniref:KdpD-like non-kinase potassium sensor n=1 Tax=Clostridium sp. JN-9 TaxID=2507159 RepID=UPI000FFE0444|nr:KdpD-like non-kinase potassium sensor [Clostridium sp. JN-9]QAT39427.1 sensor histidine kinase KdpD [Clostridium sp. JN-9]